MKKKVNEKKEDENCEKDKENGRKIVVELRMMNEI